MKWFKRFRQPEPASLTDAEVEQIERDLAFAEARSHEEVKRTYERTRDQVRRIALLEAEVELLARQGGHR